MRIRQNLVCIREMTPLAKIASPYIFVRHDGLKSFIHHRNTSADRGVIGQVFLAKEYSLEGLRREKGIIEHYQEIVRRNCVPLIVDAGANIGASAIYFSNEFPAAYMVCIEPASDNFSHLKRNMKGLNGILLNEALGSKNEMGSLLDPGEGEWGYRMTSDPSGSIRTRAMSDLVKEQVEKGLVPFIAKIDIEGCEAELFDEPNGWVEAFPLIIVELHDWLLPKQNTSRSFLQCIAARDRDFVIRGENVFSISNTLVKD